MAKKKKKDPRIVGQVGDNGELLPYENSRVLGRIDDNGNKTAFIQAQEIAPVKETGFFNDAKGSTLQKIGNTAVDATGNILKGGFSSLEGLADFGRYRGADVLDFFGANKKAKEVRETAKANTTEEIFSSINHILSGDLAGKVNENDLAAFKDIKEGSYLGDKGGQVFQGVGNSATNAALSALGGNVGGMTSLFMSAAGNAQSEAYQEGATDFQAGIYGALSGSVEAATEMMFGGLGKITQNLGFGTGALDDQLINRFTRKLSNTIAKNAVDLGLRSAGEGVEEVVAGFGNAILQKLTYMKDEDFSKLLKDQKLMDSFVSGALSSALMQAPTTLSATMQGRESSTGYTENEREVYNRELENRLKAEEKLTKRRRTQIEEQLNQDFERGYVNAQNIRDILGDKIDLKKDTRLAESFNEETRRTQAYENDVSKYDEKQAKVIQTAIDSGLLNNSNKTHDMVDLIAKLSADKGVDFDFTNNERIKDSGFAIDGRQVNGFVKDGTVNLNLESNQVLNKTVGHEITHVLEGTELYDNLQQSLKAYIGEKEWNNRISQLEKVYQNVEGANIENELTSDLVGEHIFNDENFIRNLSTKNPNLFQKIFDEIKYMVKIATAGSKEARDLEKVKRAFEKAYRETSKTQEGTQYSIQGLENYSEQEIKDISNDYIQNILTQNGLDDVEIVDTAIHGSRGRGTAREDSDLDLVVQYKGDIREDDLFNALNDNGEDNLYIDGIRVDINPIQEDLSSYMERSNQYDEEIKKNAKYSLTQDNQGRELSKEQQEYFKDSKVRDDEGNLQVVYKAEFGEDNSNVRGFFTKDLDLAKYYQNYFAEEGVYDNEGEIKETYLNIKNPLIIDAQENDYQNIPFEGKEYWTDELVKIAKERNYDGLIIENVLEGDDVYGGFKTTDYVTFNENQAKSIDNTKPTSNPDIRYSLSVEEANTTQDNEGRKLNENQLAYFKDSKAVDENGNLVTVYHTTTDRTAPFYEFNPVGTGGYRFGDQVVNYYTDSKEMSGSYADQRYRMVDTKKIDGFEDAKEWLKNRTDTNDKINIQEIYDSFGQPMYQVTSDNVPILNFTSLDELNKNLKSSLNSWIHYFKEGRNLQTEDLFGKNQYEGYANITNPYVVDADGEYWSSVRYDYDTEKVNSYKNLDQEIKDKLIKLQQESIDKFRQAKYEEDRLRETMKYHLTGRQQRLLDLFETYLPISDTDRETIASMHDLEGSLEELRKEFENPYNTLENYGATSLKEFSKEYNKVKENSLKYANNTSYFYEQAPKLLEGTGVPSNSDTWYIAGNGFNEDSILENFETKRTTNDIVKEVIASNKSGETNYDGVIIKNVVDYGGDAENHAPHDLYVTFNSNQFKAVDNLNPTNDADIRYQLGNNEVAPTSGWNVRSEDVRLQSAFKDTIAPLQEQVQELSNTINELKKNIPQREYRPLTEQEGEQLAEEYANRDISNELAPVSENLTEEENQRLAVLDLLERNNMLDEEHQYERDQLLEKANPTIPNEEATPGKALEDIRDIEEVGKRNVKAYQYEHPEVKPYFQQEARGMLSDLQNSQKGERFMFESPKQGQGTNWEVLGIKRFTSPEIADLLDSKYGYTYKDIEKGLKAIIEDHGAENIAVAKRIEFILDDNLRNGYTDWQTGMEIPPNQDYLNMLAEQEWNEYYDNIQEQYPLEPYTPVEENVPDYFSIEDEDVSDMKIDKDLQDMTVDDINLEPFLEGLVKADERQKARQEMDKKVVNRNEYTPKKKGIIGRAIDLYKSITNEFAVVDKFAKDVKNPTITHKIDTWNNYVPLAQTNITTAQTDINGNAIGRSVDSIWSEADKLGVREILDEYLKHWSNVDRGKRGKGALDYSAKESYKKVQEIKEQHPEVHRLAKDCWQLYRNARHNLRDAGTISQQQSDAIGRANPHYNPFISENLDAYFTETGELKPRKTIKSAKGGAELEGLLSSEEAMKKYMYSQFAETTGNDAFLEIVKSSPNQFVFGTDDRTGYVNQDHLSVDKDGYYLTAYENGEPVTARISKEMYDSLSRQTKHRVDEFVNKYESILKPIEKFGNLRRKMLTELSPSFLLKNPGKDFQEAVINSKYTKDMIANYMNPQTWIELANGTGEASQFRNLYGSGLVMGQYDIDISKIDPKSKNFNFLKKLGNANEYMELITRYAEFKASRQNGASIQEAMYNAREVTTNFSRGNPIVKAFNKYGMTFLNSSVQGFDKFIRNFSGENGAKGVVNSLAKAVIFGIAPAVFNELAFGTGDDKDEEYEAIPDYIKDNYYIIKTGDGNFVRIPKGRVFSVFGSAARRTIEMMEGEENAFEGYWNNVQQQIGINNPEENNIFAPLIQAMGGRKLDSGQTAGEAWYGGDIIPSRLQKERPEDQYDASIDKFSIWLGQKTGISPYKINYVLDQYSGGIGDLILPMITPEANSDGSVIAPIKDQFTADSTTDNKYVSEFYDTKGKLYTGSKATDEDILKNKYMNSISSEMAKLYAERREVQADDSLTKKQKYAKSQEIKAEINRLAKEGMDNYNDIIMSNNYAKIGDTEYYKNANGQWTKVNDDVASLGLDTEEKNEYYKVKNEIYTTKKNNDGYDKPLVIQDIVNSNLTPDAKVNLYTSNYKDDLVQPLVDSGMDVDSYLEYKSQDFSADKDSNGKSISGSKKRKVFDYINSMNIPYEQKLILAKSEYNSFNQNNYDIINYIENSGMSYDERIELYKNLGFKVDGDNISW